MMDAELVARSRANDTGAFGALVERHQRLVFGVALARCGDPVLAEDVAQEAFVTAWRELKDLRDVERVGAWMAGIARNLAATASRKRARGGEGAAAIATEPVAAVATPEDEALEREDRELLARALAEVPEAHREALVLFYIEGESIANIAAVLDVREDLVKQRLSRGRKALRENVANRVERALTNLKSLRASVVAAVSLAAAHKAKGATLTSGASGKLIAMITAKQLAVAAIAICGIAGGAIYYATRSTPRDVAIERASGEVHAGPATSPASPSSGARRIDPVEHAKLLEAIRTVESAKHATAPAPAAIGGGGGAGGASEQANDGDLDHDYIRQSVHELLPALTDCYTEGLTRNPKLEGEVEIDFTIEGEPDIGGVVSDSSINAEKSTLDDDVVRDCIAQTMYGLEIDPPKNGGKVSVHYPFAFSSN